MVRDTGRVVEELTALFVEVISLSGLSITATTTGGAERCRSRVGVSRRESSLLLLFEFVRLEEGIVGDDPIPLDSIILEDEETRRGDSVDDVEEVDEDRVGETIEAAISFNFSSRRESEYSSRRARRDTSSAVTERQISALGQ